MGNDWVNMENSTNNLASLVAVEFHGQYIVATMHDGHPYVAMKPICENIGLQWEAQYKRIMRHPAMAQGMSIMDIPSSGGVQQTACLRTIPARAGEPQMYRLLGHLFWDYPRSRGGTWHIGAKKRKCWLKLLNCCAKKYSSN